MEKEKRLIDANALLEDLGDEPMVWSDGEAEIQERNDWQRFKACVEAQDTVDAVEVVHGYWIKHEYAEEENGLLVPNYECSVCHSWERDEGYYCPNCGAKMDGDEQ